MMLASEKPLIPVVGEYFGGIWTLILFGSLAYSSYQALQQLNWAESHRTDEGDDSGSGSSGRAPWEQDPDYWKR